MDFRPQPTQRAEAVPAVANVQSASKEQMFKFYLHTIRFKPKNANSDFETNEILRKVTGFINDEKMKGKAYILDRHEQRVDGERRELFMNYAVESLRDKVIKCSIALLKAGKKPMVKPKDRNELIPFDEANGSIAFLTHFFIDYSVSPAIMCVEFNNDGPRLSDIEFYFRNIAHKKLRLCKETTTTTFMDRTIDKTLEEFQNVLKFEFKLDPQNITYMDTELKGYYSAMSSIGNTLKPKFIKVETLFQTPGTKVKSKLLNKEANNMFKNILKTFRAKEHNIELFENFQVTYEDKEGTEQLFNLINGKKEILVKALPEDVRKTTQFFELVKDQFNDFVAKYRK